MRPREGLIMVTVLTALLSVSSVSAAPPVLVEAARDLIESVLGAGTVQAIRSAGDGSDLLVRWDSPTFLRAANVGDARQMMYAEAVVVTGTIFGHLRGVRRVRFTLVRGERMLATGEHIRGQDARMIFAGELGGPYTPSAPGTPPKPKPSGGATQEL